MSADAPAVKELGGPSVHADALRNGTNRHVGAGDVVIIPAELDTNLVRSLAPASGIW
jgi:hypothetical protein